MISSLKLAKLCGVSQGTVDRALHDRPEISAKTKIDILRMAQQYGYRPNPVARELLSGQSRLVGAVLPILGGVFFLDLFAHLKSALEKEGLRVLLAPVTSTPEFLEALEDFACRRARAAIIIPPEPGLRIPEEWSRDMRMLSLLEPCEGVPFISPDEEKIGRDAVDYLWRRGHRQIIHVHYRRKSYAMKARAQGYAERMRERGGRPMTLTAPSERRLLSALRERCATALFCHNDWLALATIRILERNGLRVPADVSVLGVDGSPTFTSLNPGITTIQYPFATVAEQAATVITGSRRKRGGAHGSKQSSRTRFPPPRILAGNSVAGKELFGAAQTSGGPVQIE